MPGRVKAGIKIGSKAGYYRKRIEALRGRTDSYDLLLGVPLHTNLGDHLIALAEKDWLTEKTGREIVEIPTEAFTLFRKELAGLHLAEDATVYITGGGWMGDLWQPEEKLIEDMADTFRDHRIVILPQTIYYADKNHPLIERGNAIYSRCRDITLCVREQASYDFAEENLSVTRTLLLPDIGLLYRYDKAEEAYMPTLRAGICLRGDREVSRKDSFTEKIISMVRAAGYETEEISTMSPARVPESERRAAVNAALDTFSSCSIIVADRLHGMIFAYLTGVPCIALDNKTGKVSGVYRKWLSDCSYILMTDSGTDMSEIKRFISMQMGRKYIPRQFDSYFDVLLGGKGAITSDGKDS